MKMAFVLYDQVTALDFVGPLDVFSRWPDAQVQFVASSPASVRTDSGLPLTPTATLDESLDADLVVVPGSARPFGPLNDTALMKWLRAVSAQARWTTSVCSGAGLLAKAGLLDGRQATTHYAFREAVAAMGAQIVNDRVVFAGSIVTAAGVSAGIDMALTLTDREHGSDVAKMIQLAIEYDPHPPFDSGTPEKAGEHIVELTRRAMMGWAGLDVPGAASAT